MRNRALPVSDNGNFADIHVAYFHENDEACIEIQRRRYDELSLKTWTNSVWREKRRE